MTTTLTPKRRLAALMVRPLLCAVQQIFPGSAKRPSHIDAYAAGGGIPRKIPKPISVQIGADFWLVDID
jgi:hypothetical protein